VNDVTTDSSESHLRRTLTLLDMRPRIDLGATLDSVTVPIGMGMNAQICSGGSHGLEGVPQGGTTFPCPICKAHAEVMWPRRTTNGCKPLPRLELHTPAVQHVSVAGRT
jgi:hypothetical protein